MNNFFFINTAYASVDSFIANANRLIINPLIYLLFALALVFFSYGVFQFLANQEDETKRTDGKSHMLWGLVGIAVMFAVWAMLNIILNTFGIEGIDPEKGKVELNNYNPVYPKVE